MKNFLLTKKVFVIMTMLALCSFGQSTGDAPPRPTCSNSSPCGFNTTNGLAGTRIVVSDIGGGHGASKNYLRGSLTRLSQQYGFTVTYASNRDDITDNDLQNAKVIMFSNGDGTSGGSVPNTTVRARIEDFVQNRGWGFMSIHAACAFISNWTFHQDACVQQYFHHNNAGTQATIRVADIQNHGRQNPYTDFLLEGLPDNVTMRDEWYTWRGNPRTTHERSGGSSQNKIVLLRMDESGVPVINPQYGNEHWLVWTTTMGEGVNLYNSTGHDDTYAQDGQRRAYGDSLLWRQIRYVAKDWGPATVPVVDRAREGSFQQVGNILYFNLPNTGNYNVTLENLSGARIDEFSMSGGEASFSTDKYAPGLYFIKAHQNGQNVIKRKVLVM